MLLLLKLSSGELVAESCGVAGLAWLRSPWFGSFSSFSGRGVELLW
jgi:hypothetical protein